MSNKKWYEYETGDNLVYQEVFTAANNIRNNQLNWDDLDQRHFRLYSGLPLYTMFNSSNYEMGDTNLTMNVVQSSVNTMVSKITKNKVRPSFLTDDGDWGMQQQAKKLDRYVFGQFYKTSAYEETKAAFRDACIFGDGFVKHWHDDRGDIHIKRVFKPSLMFDLAEVLYSGDPKTVYEIRICDKQSVKEKYPGMEREIDDAKLSDFPFFIDSYESAMDLIAVVEAYRVGIKPESKEDGEEKKYKGKHFIGISTCTFVYEDFNMESIPYIRIPFVPNAMGYLSKGIAELITGHQVEINRTLRRISRAMNLMTSPAIFVDYMSEIIDTHFNNDVGTVVKYKNTPPIYNFPGGISPVVIEWMQLVYNKAFEEVGLSQLTAQSKKPEGLDSGKALREYNDIETERFAEVALNWEKLHLDLSKAIIDHSVLIAKAGGKPVVLSPDKMGALKINFNEIKLKDSEYVMQCYPTAMLPKTPAGRLSFVQEMIASQMIDSSEGLSLLEFPDVASITDTKTAHIDDIKYTAYLIINDGEYVAPEPFQNLQFGIMFMNAQYLKMKTRNLPVERLDLLQRWINDALSLQEQMTQPPVETELDVSPDMMTGEMPMVDETMMNEQGIV
jgi:hypothetical protein